MNDFPEKENIVNEVEQAESDSSLEEEVSTIFSDPTAHKKTAV